MKKSLVLPMLLSPLASIPGVAIGLAIGLLSPANISGLNSGLSIDGLLSLFGLLFSTFAGALMYAVAFSWFYLPVAYIGVLLWGIPMHLLVLKLGVPRLWLYLFGSLVPAAMFLQFVSLPGHWLNYAMVFLSCLLVAWFFWWLAVARPEKVRSLTIEMSSTHARLAYFEVNNSRAAPSLSSAGSPVESSRQLYF